MELNNIPLNDEVKNIDNNNIDQVNQDASLTPQDLVENAEEIKLKEDELFLRSMLPRDDNEKRRVVIALHRTYIIDRTGR